MDFKKRKSIEKPLCKYGESCYQKNPEHRKKFKHPRKKKDGNLNSAKDVVDVATSEVSGIPTLEILETSSTSYLYNSIDVGLEESVADILKSMPQDFFEFWNFCSVINKSNPQDAFSDFRYKLVGVYDLLAKKLPTKMKVDISCHWRYFYDPPEFQTVIKKDGKDEFHIGYFRDDPSEKPAILASNSAAIDGKLTLVGDNIFCAMNVELNKVLMSSLSEATKSKASKLKEELHKFASRKHYSINVSTDKTKQRQKTIVTGTFHGLGIVVPVINKVGYRPLFVSNAALKRICEKIVSAETEEKRLEEEEHLDELITNVNFANDECDFGMGLELGIDLFCYGHPYFHNCIESLLTVAYNLLKRPKYALILKAHLKKRKKGEILRAFNL